MIEILTRLEVPAGALISQDPCTTERRRIPQPITKKRMRLSSSSQGLYTKNTTSRSTLTELPCCTKARFLRNAGHSTLPQHQRTQISEVQPANPTLLQHQIHIILNTDIASPVNIGKIPPNTASATEPALPDQDTAASRIKSTSII